MRTSDLPSPGRLRISQKLRVLCAQALGALDIRKDGGGTDVDGLGAFFVACAEKAGAIAAGAAQVVNAAVVNVRNSAVNKTVAGTAVVTSGVLTGINLPATTALVNNAEATLAIQNSAGAAIGSGTAAVAAGVVSNIKLPATVAGVSSGQKVNAGTVSGTGNFATFTVANGVITGITLSAS